MSLLFFIFFVCLLKKKRAHKFFFARAVRAVLARVFRSFIRRAGRSAARRRAHHYDRRTLEVGCSSALCLGFSCCRGRASGELGLLRCRCGCLRPALCCVRLSIAPSSRRRRATTTGGRLQPRLSSSRRAGSQGRAAALPTCRRFGAARRACQREEPAVRCFFGRTKSGSSFLQE